MRRPGRGGLAAAALTMLGVLLLVIGTPTSFESLTVKVTNTKDTSSSGIWNTTTCLAQAKAQSAYFFYRLDEASGTTAADASGNSRAGTYSSGGVTYRSADGPCAQDAQSDVITLDGSTGYVVGPQVNGVTSTTVFTEQIWFKTNTKTGGKLIGLGNSGNATASGQYDRHVYMQNDGKLVFGTYNNGLQVVTTSSAYNDNAWHQVVATFAPSGTYKGMRLYVDGALATSNDTYVSAEGGSSYYVRIGYDNLDGWSNVPSSRYFKGSIADASVYITALTPAQVTAHYNAGR